jgi:hypothetical protein
LILPTDIEDQSHIQYTATCDSPDRDASTFEDADKSSAPASDYYESDETHSTHYLSTPPVRRSKRVKRKAIDNLIENVMSNALAVTGVDSASDTVVGSSNASSSFEDANVRGKRGGFDKDTSHVTIEAADDGATGKSKNRVVNILMQNNAMDETEEKFRVIPNDNTDNRIFTDHSDHYFTDDGMQESS